MVVEQGFIQYAILLTPALMWVQITRAACETRQARVARQARDQSVDGDTSIHTSPTSLPSLWLAWIHWVLVHKKRRLVVPYPDAPEQYEVLRTNRRVIPVEAISDTTTQASRKGQVHKHGEPNHTSSLDPPWDPFSSIPSNFITWNTSLAFSISSKFYWQ